MNKKGLSKCAATDVSSHAYVQTNIACYPTRVRFLWNTISKLKSKRFGRTLTHVIELNLNSFNDFAEMKKKVCSFHTRTKSSIFSHNLCDCCRFFSTLEAKKNCKKVFIESKQNWWWKKWQAKNRKKSIFKIRVPLGSKPCSLHAQALTVRHTRAHQIEI